MWDLSVCIYSWHVCMQCLLLHLFKNRLRAPTSLSTLTLHTLASPCVQNTHTVIWPTHTHTLWLARQRASFMKSFLSDAALCWTHASLWADITQSASQQLPDFLLSPVDRLSLCKTQHMMPPRKISTIFVFFYTCQYQWNLFLLKFLKPCNALHIIDTTE